MLYPMKGYLVELFVISIKTLQTFHSKVLDEGKRNEETVLKLQNRLEEQSKM